MEKRELLVRNNSTKSSDPDLDVKPLGLRKTASYSNIQIIEATNEEDEDDTVDFGR
jgi:hypothetical protein